MNLDRLITVVGAHAEGEVGRVITGGVLPPIGDTMFERMRSLERDSVWLRNMLLFDPRGSVNAAVNLITPACHPLADFGMIVMESDHFVPMSGSNLICTVTVALETGIIQIQEPKTVVTVDTPAGLVEVEAECQGESASGSASETFHPLSCIGTKLLMFQVWASCAWMSRMEV